jgi:uncharacterized protein DUF2188
MSDHQQLFIEKRDEGDFAIRRGKSQRASAVEDAQAEAIARARQLDPNATIMVERVRYTGVGRPDKWQKP